MRRAALFFCIGPVLCAQTGGTEPKPDAAQYEVHGRRGEIGIGAEYLIHSISGQGKTFFLDDFLVVEVALYPPKDAGFRVGPGAFELRVNGKAPLRPAGPAMVVTALRYPQWRTGPRVEGAIGAGPADVILGRPPNTYPGGSRTPTPPRAPEPDAPAGIDREPPVKAEDIVTRMALPEGDFATPVSGFLYFPYKGKASGIKRVDLLWEDIVLKLR